MRSAGLLPFRRDSGLEVLVAHPGGPFWARRDAGAWSIVKGLIEDDEEARTAAAREFTEETGWLPPPEPWFDLGEVQLRSGKHVIGWAAEADYDPDDLEPGTFVTTIGGREVAFPEIDRVGWFPPDVARHRLNPVYGKFLDELERRLGMNG